MTLFVGILDGAGDVWGVRVPDIPGCHGGGDTPEAAIQDAISALRELSDEVIATKPRSMAEVTADSDCEFAPAAGESIVILPFFPRTVCSDLWR
jgi:predicted RNase H-like HicB family nuclease